MSEWGVDLGCVSCKHLISAINAKCKAFPDGIPYLISSGEFDHRKKFPGQKNDILYQEKE